jgi:hypothetical protein
MINGSEIYEISQKLLDAVTTKDYKNDLEISFHDLEDHWKRQGTLYMKWGELHANSIRLRDRAKEKLEVLKAEKGAYIRDFWSEEDYSKPLTVDGVKDWVANNDEVKGAVSDLIKATENMNLMGVAKGAFEHKKKALEMLTQLYLIGYFSKPKLQETNEPFGDPQQKALDAKQKKRRRKR